MKEIQLCAQTVALDNYTTGDTNITNTIGWPGTNIPFHVWVTNMGKKAGMSERDLIQLFSAPGVELTNLPQYTEGKTALRVYQVSEDSPSDAVFLSTFNWNAENHSTPLSPKSIPYGDRGFAIFHKGGDGAVYKARQATNNSNFFGTLLKNIAP